MNQEDMDSNFNKIILSLEEKFSRQKKDTDEFLVKRIPFREHGYLDFSFRINKVGKEKQMLLFEIVLDGIFKERYTIHKIGYANESKFTTIEKVRHVNQVIENADRISVFIEKFLEIYALYNRHEKHQLQLNINKRYISIIRFHSRGVPTINIHGPFIKRKEAIEINLTYYSGENERKTYRCFFDEFEKPDFVERIKKDIAARNMREPEKESEYLWSATSNFEAKDTITYSDSATSSNEISGA